MKYYLADFNIRDGDNEYEFRFLAQAENLEDAEEKAMEGACFNFGLAGVNGMKKLSIYVSVSVE